MAIVEATFNVETLDSRRLWYCYLYLGYIGAKITMCSLLRDVSRCSKEVPLPSVHAVKRSNKLVVSGG